MLGTLVAEAATDDAPAAAATWAYLDARGRTARRCLLQSTPTRCINPYDTCGGGKHTLRRRPRTTRRDEENAEAGHMSWLLLQPGHEYFLPVMYSPFFFFSLSCLISHAGRDAAGCLRSA